MQLFEEILKEVPGRGKGSNSYYVLINPRSKEVSDLMKDINSDIRSKVQDYNIKMLSGVFYPSNKDVYLWNGYWAIHASIDRKRNEEKQVRFYLQAKRGNFNSVLLTLSPFHNKVVISPEDKATLIRKVKGYGLSITIGDELK